MHKRYLTVALCCVAVGAAGCGSSGPSPTNTTRDTGPASPEVFGADLTGLCQAGKAAFAQAGQDPSKAVTILSGLLPQFKALNTSAPPRVKAAYAQFEANLAAELADLRAHNVQGAAQAALKNRALGSQLKAPSC